jgi:hypothetical protein
MGADLAFSQTWVSMASWNGHGRFWTAASSRRKKGGRRDRIDQGRQGDEADAADRWNRIPLALLIAGANRKRQREKWEEEYKER